MNDTFRFAAEFTQTGGTLSDQPAGDHRPITSDEFYSSIPDTPLTLFLIAGSVFLIMFYRFSIIISHLRDDNIALAQRVAILEYHIRSIRAHEKR